MAHEGRVYTVSGPEPLRPADRARILGEVLGRDLRFEGQPDDEARAEMSAAMPAEYVDAFFDFYVTGTLDESQPQPDVRDVTGREPRTFAPVGPGPRGRLQAQLKARAGFAVKNFAATSSPSSAASRGRSTRSR